MKLSQACFLAAGTCFALCLPLLATVHLGATAVAAVVGLLFIVGGAYADELVTP